jgi:hypothetical protein
VPLLDVYGEDSADGKVQAKVFTKRNQRSPGPRRVLLPGILPTLLKTRFGPRNVTLAPGMASLSLTTNLAVQMERRPSRCVTITPWVPTKPRPVTMSCSRRSFSKKSGEDRLAS